jgi:hypothetical protein
MTRLLSWYSCGAASAVATKLMLAEGPCEIVYCDTGAEHEDNARFLADCEAWFKQPIVRIKSDKYADTWSVWEKTRWLAGIEGARCTDELKKQPRFAYQKPHDKHVFGYTCDSADIARFERFKANFPELSVRAPLIERGISKAGAIGFLQSAGIKPPVMYALGFQNNNCIPCVKATSPDYWSLVRLRFPAKFKRMALLSRELDVRLTRLNGERAFIDQIPADWPVTDPIAPACDFLCQIALEDAQ